ncbi:uncharacterized protein K444DRAFT_121359 [Hyaloscypha bicolor E]|uniref:Uncharacterized protein n=1 Tax=Hyaloscypha bicolor E TaxID=1095630 RepID=A0A2J6TU97_9HELO|nr:uncharacterized protein K444DRAFT_121359 [Hyaloscypha bicolor E]PMD66571.1 hypothetical protein K444DRAFT_121359 [Hyaloscypha bicolor E]
MEQPFTEVEKRFVLAEAIKLSTISVDRLFSVLAEHNVSPDWEQMLLPHGRNLLQCKHAFNSLQHGPSSQLSTPQPFTQTFLNPPPVYSSSSGGKRQSMNMPPGPGPDQKRPRKSGAETPTLARDLLPKPANPNGGSPMSTMASSPPATTSQKKRGRPSKADVERKQREAIERGEIITPAAQSPAGMPGPDDSRSGYAPVSILPAPPGPRETVMGGIMPSILSPRTGSFPQMVMGPDSPASIGAEPTGKKRKPRPPPKPKVQKPGEHQFSINTPTGQAGQGETPSAPVPTDAAQAVPIAAAQDLGNPPPNITPAAMQDSAPGNQSAPDDK